MAHDLDDEELEATRKLNKTNRKNGSDINVGSIEEEIKEYKINLTIKQSINQLKNILNKFELRGESLYLLKEATKNILQDYTRQKQINVEQQKENDLLKEKVRQYEELIKDYQRMYCRAVNDSILKQKIIDKIQERKFELQQEYKDFEDDKILQVLEELLQEEDK